MTGYRFQLSRVCYDADTIMRVKVRTSSGAGVVQVPIVHRSDNQMETLLSMQKYLAGGLVDLMTIRVFRQEGGSGGGREGGGCFNFFLYTDLQNPNPVAGGICSMLRYIALVFAIMHL